MKAPKQIVLIILAILFNIVVISTLVSVFSSVTSCTWPALDVFNPDPIITDTIPNDTIIPITPDTCFTLENLSDTSFVLLAVSLDSMPDTLKWEYLYTPNVYYDNLVELLKKVVGPQYKYTYYQEGNSVAVFIDGTSNQLPLQGRIGVRDGNGIRTWMTAYSQAFFLWGALTPQEAITEANHRLNILSFHNRGESSWTQAQRDTYNRAIMHFHECKHGETRADFRGQLVTQSVKDSAILYKWKTVLQ